MNQDIYDVLSLKTDADKKALKGFIDEAIAARTKIKDQQEAIRDIRNEAKEKLNVSGKVFNKIVNAIAKDAITKEKQEYDEFETIIETLYPQD